MTEENQPTTSDIWTPAIRDRILLTIGAIVCYFVFGFIAQIFSFPRYPGFDASLLQHPNAPIIVLMVFVTLVACTILATVIAGVVHFEAGLFCAAIGLLALTTRGGPIRYVLFDASSSGVFFKLAIEMLLLSLGIVAGWSTLTFMRTSGFLHGEEFRETHREYEPAFASQAPLTLVMQIILMALLMLIFAQTDKKAQVIWSIAISSCIASLAVHSLFPVRPSYWFWTAPLIVGLLGYVVAALTSGYAPIGMVDGFLPQLARPLPLDYASAGPAGALLGYWTSRHWHIEREQEPEEPEQVERALEHPTA